MSDSKKMRLVEAEVIFRVQVATLIPEEEAAYMEDMLQDIACKGIHTCDNVDVDIDTDKVVEIPEEMAKKQQYKLLDEEDVANIYAENTIF